MENLLPHYERELALLRRSMQTFTASYPKVGARLAISGEHSDDVHVERMLQSLALLSARIGEKLEDDFPEFTEALLEGLYPEFLRPFPSCSIAQFQAGNLLEELTAPRTINRGTQFTAHVSKYRFRTSFDVVLARLQIAKAGFVPAAVAPMGVQLPPETTGMLSVTFASISEGSTIDVVPDRVRIHLGGQHEIVAALADGFLLYAAGAFVEPNGCGKWKRLARMPVSDVGFGEAEMLLGDRADTVSPFRLLAEYFAFPARFDFVDVNLAALRRAAGPCQRLTLHLALREVRPDSRVARCLGEFTADNLKLFCTPVVNLFASATAPIDVEAGVAAYPLVPHGMNIADVDVWSVDQVRMMQPTSTRQMAVPPFHSLQHGSAAWRGLYWTVRRNEHVARERPGCETELTLVGLDGLPVETGPLKLDIDLTCTNRNLPASLPLGLPEGNLETEQTDLKCPIALLMRPTESTWPSYAHGALWLLISHLTPQSLRLTEAGLEDLKQLFRLFARRTGGTTRHIDGITQLAHRPVTQWMAMKPAPGLVRGIEVTLTIDEQTFVGSSLDTFIRVMDCFFAPYAAANSFVQLAVISASTGIEIRRCPPRAGIMPLV